jgi:hypothetical protein
VSEWRPRPSTLSLARLRAGGRVVMVGASAAVQAQGLVIALRYLSVRRQFHGSSDDEVRRPLPATTPSASSNTPTSVARFRVATPTPVEDDTPAGPSSPPAARNSLLAPRLEQRIIDYPVQQRRLIPLLASCFAGHAAGTALKAMHATVQSKMAALTGGRGGGSVADVVEGLKELHSTSAGLKAAISWAAYASIDTCRQASTNQFCSGDSTPNHHVCRRVVVMDTTPTRVCRASSAIIASL